MVKRILINAFETTLSSRLPLSKKSKIRDDIFLYIENIKKINRTHVNEKKNIHKFAKNKSKKSKKYYFAFKKIIFPTLKKCHANIDKLNLKLIQNGYLFLENEKSDISLKYNQPFNDGWYENLNCIINENDILIQKTIMKFSVSSSKIESKKLIIKAENKAKELFKYISLKTDEISKKLNSIGKFKKDIYIEKDNHRLFSAKKALKKFKIIKRKVFIGSLIDAIKNYFKFIKTNKLLFGKFLWIIKFHFLKSVGEETKIILAENKEKSWELEYQYRKYNYIINQSLSLLKYIDLNLKKIRNEEINKMKKKNFSIDELKKIKSDFKISKKELINQHKYSLKLNKFSSRGINLERKNLKSKILEKKYNIFNNNKYLKSKIYYKAIKNKFKLDLKFRIRKISNDLDDLTKIIPLEYSKKRYWLSIIFGSIVPGTNSIINKQYLKGIFQLLGTSIIMILLSYSFGAFPSANGNGVAGIGRLGAVSQDVLGKTNGVVNDSRFFLVSGALGIIFMVFSILYYLISILNNINSNNVARMGVRYANWRQQKKLLRNQGLPYLISAPALLFIIFIVVLPLIATILITFTNFGQKTFDPISRSTIVHNGTTVPIEWVGFDQFKYITVSLNKDFTSVLTWTIIWTLGSTCLTLIVGTLMAILVNQKRIYGKTLWRVIYILPWAIPAFISIMYFSIFFSSDGVFNKFFSVFAGTDWKTGPDVYKTKILLMILQTWLGHSYIFLLITGTMKSIPNSLYEASRVDGASSWKQFRKITIPIILLQISPLIIGQFTFNFNNFGIIYLFNEGGSVLSGHYAGTTDIFISWIYKMVNGQNPIPGAAAALSLVISIFIVTPSAILFLRSKSFRKVDF